VKIERNDMRMIRWRRRVKLTDGMPNEELRRKLGIKSMKAVLRRRLRWFGYVERKEDDAQVKKSIDLRVDG
jgi:hypothetical protein